MCLAARSCILEMKEEKKYEEIVTTIELHTEVLVMNSSGFCTPNSLRKLMEPWYCIWE